VGFCGWEKSELLVCRCYLVSFLKHMPIFDLVCGWVWIEEIGLHLQILLIVSSSTVNIT
jgi:hypothetical protein